MLSELPVQLIIAEAVVTTSKADVIEVSGGTNSGLFSESKGLNSSTVSHEKKINTIPRRI